MEYKRFNNKIVARIDKDEEILEQLKKDENYYVRAVFDSN